MNKVAGFVPLPVPSTVFTFTFEWLYNGISSQLANVMKETSMCLIVISTLLVNTCVTYTFPSCEQHFCEHGVADIWPSLCFQFFGVHALERRFQDTGVFYVFHHIPISNT